MPSPARFRLASYYEQRERELGEDELLETDESIVGFR
jgi:hypothetical protein